MTVTAVVPARKDSQGIPGKNLRLHNGKPLFLNTALKLREAGAERTIVATDDPTVASLARIHQFDIHWRTPVGPNQTLAELADEIDRAGQVGMFQCTCPNATVETYRAILAHDGPLVTVVAPTHLYRKLNGKPIGEAVNRQQLALKPALWQETGVAKIYGEGRPALYEVSQHEALDLDTTGDWAQLQNQEYAEKTVEWKLASDLNTGSGHTRRFLTLYRTLPTMGHRVAFTDPDTWLAQEVRDNVGNEVQFVEDGNNDRPDLVVWDQLDVPYAPAREYFGLATPQIALESEGYGLEHVQVHIDEFTPTGRLFAVVRPEFSAVPPLDRYQVDNILITFGGTDPENYTAKALGALSHIDAAKYCVLPGNREPMVELMAAADLVVCSAGRTVYEAVVAGRPVIKVPVNNRERRHDHGTGVWQSDLAHLGSVVEDALTKPDHLKWGVETAQWNVDGRGAQRTADLLCQTLNVP